MKAPSRTPTTVLLAALLLLIGVLVFFAAGPIEFALLAAAVLGAARLWRHLREKARTNAVRPVAQSLGFAFTPSHDDALGNELQGYYLFPKHSPWRIGNLMRRREGATEIVLFDYIHLYRTALIPWQHTVAAFRGADIELPLFCLRPRGNAKILAQALGNLVAIDLSAHSGFSGRYVLQAPRSRKLHQLFCEEVLDYFAATDGVYIDAGGHWLLYYRAGKQVAPADIAAFLDEAQRACEVLCRSARKEP